MDGGTRYYYVKNLQGDITMLVDENGSVAARYTYDHQGAVVSVLRGNGAPATDPYHIANLNPLRYRGYVYDTDSGLYYLQSRYYDPDTGRFINADVYCDTGNSVLSTNMFAYCENNPVNFVDPSGTDAWLLQDSDGVFYMGHTSLLIQERPGRWWYFYWGDNRIKLVYIGTCTLNSLNSYLNTHTNVAGKFEYNRKTFRWEWKNYREAIYDGTYEKRIILKGDFSKSLSYIYYNLMGGTKGITTKVLISNPNYNLLFRNCMQVSMEALSKGTFYDNNRYNKLAIGIAKLLIVPNQAYTFYLSSQMMLKAAYGVSYAWAWLRSYL